MFPTLPSAQIEYIIRDSGSRWLVVSDAKQVAKALDVRATHPELRIITMDGDADAANDVLTFADVLERGGAEPLNDEEYAARWQAVGPGDLASIVYTSGTTGDPKGVMLTHRNFAANIESSQAVLTFDPSDVLLSFLPLNHCFERMAGYYLPLSCGAQIAYAQSIRRLRENIREVEPTYMILVPRVYEAFEEGVRGRVADAPALRRRMFAWALSVGGARDRRIQSGQSIPPLLALQWSVASSLVFGKVRQAGGFQRLKYFVSGGAALAPATADFFHAAGMPIIEGYGMTEAAPIISVNRPGKYKTGTVGPPAPAIEVRIAENGEIVCRGENVMLGYHNQPEATAAVIDGDGWLHTGDVGEIDEDGYVRITDRIKDIIVLSNGENVAPQPIESQLKSSPHISQIVLFGDGREVMTAIGVPDFDSVRAWASDGGISLPEETEDLIEIPEVRELILAEIGRLSEGLTQYQRVRDIALLPQELTPENDELTPTLKVKRRVVVERYGHLLWGTEGES